MELLGKIENRLRLLMTVTIFFSTLTYNYFIFAKAGEEAAHDNLLRFGGLIGIYIFTYVLFELFGKQMNVVQLKYFSYLLLVGIASFILPTLTFGSEQLNTKGIFDFAFFGGSLIAMISVAFLSLISIAALPIWNSIRKYLSK